MLQCVRDALRTEMRCLPSSPSTSQKTAIAIKRQKLWAKITKFNQKAALLTAGMDAGGLEIVADDPLFAKRRIVRL